MGVISGEGLLRLPVTLRGIRLGQPVDLLLDLVDRHALGLVVLCRDETYRFLPWAAVQADDDEIRVASPLMLLEDVDFYRARSDSFRALLGGVVRRHGAQVGALHDVELERTGKVAGVAVTRDGVEERLDAEGTSLSSERAAA
ncbi:MAG TPA: hypothetical protein VHD91_00325 [Gaiellaceae bacterium]|nr:hypothetical protein [Gaiellaceae bacterium]